MRWRSTWTDRSRLSMVRTVASASHRLWILIPLLGAVFAAGEASPTLMADAPQDRLRVLCYNIHHGEGTDQRVDLERLAEVISAVEPDLVALQEVDDRTQRTGGVDQTAKLAELTGLHGRFARQIDFEGGHYGQAFLSRFPLSEVTIHWLPGVPERERRIAASVSVRLPDRQPLTFISTHLHHANGEFRKQQAAALNGTFGESDEIAILVGDLNATPESEPLSILSRKWTSATAGQTRLTFPAGTPERQLDYVLYRPANRLNVVKSEVPDEPVASDHRPLLVEFELPDLGS
jgi:endonuclease/exonuclease/phosphatase family metal-dependent hydrolase